jgi:hypothetical protein
MKRELNRGQEKQNNTMPRGGDGWWNNKNDKNGKHDSNEASINEDIMMTCHNGYKR